MHTHTALAGLLLVLASSSVACGGAEPIDVTTTTYAAAVPPAATTTEDRHGEERWLFLSAIDPGVAGAHAWRTQGFDLDRIDTSREHALEDVGTCKHLDGAVKTALADGDHGIDNSFGNTVLAIWRSVDEGAADLPSLAAVRGDGFLVRVSDVGGDDDAHAPGTLWVVRDGRPVGRAVSLPDAYVAKGVWVANPAALPLRLASNRLSLDLELSRSVLAIDLRAGKGTIGGLLPAATLAATLDAAQEKVTKAPPVFASLVPTIADASLGSDPSAPCDAVSFGATFSATATALRPIAAPSAAPKVPAVDGLAAPVVIEPVPTSAPADLPPTDGTAKDEGSASAG